MAFKKPFHDIKTSAPLRSSDRRKLKQRIVQTFSLEAETGDTLVPESLLSLKFNTHLDEPGVAYLSPEGDPLWFSLGKASNDLIPTVYTLWKQPTLLPVLSTPPAVIPVLMGGADLMIPGVIQHPHNIRRTDLVAVTHHVTARRALTPPLAVGRMAVHAEELQKDVKGKAVHILHTFGDSLWGMGRKSDIPDSFEMSPFLTKTDGANEPDEAEATSHFSEIEQDKGEGPSRTVESHQHADMPSAALPETTPQGRHLQSTRQITEILRRSTIQAIYSQLSKLPPSAFPITSSTLYSTYILPSRPLSSQAISTPVDIKHSNYKNLTAFLRTIEKDGFLRLKDFKGDLNILGVNASHPEIQAHVSYQTVGDKEKREETKTKREKSDRGKVKEIIVRELWKPHAQSVQFFEAIGKNPKDLYSLIDLRTIINEYAASHSLANAREQQYIHPDELLLSVLVAPKSGETVPYIKRDEAVKRLYERMQNWHEVAIDGEDPVIRKGQLNPVSVMVKVRQGRKASTLVTGCETFFVSPEFMGDELKRICATSTSVSPVPGKGNMMEVLVQGKQIKAVTEFLIEQGVPKRWIVAADHSEKKK
ncbi:hypothetical protein JB92DRAFT_2752438 [Gautieria morchelliformis]|nr:hypothetical protein JB92DRAFT_2752438 [Gautieria morchelliformis]